MQSLDLHTAPHVRKLIFYCAHSIQLAYQTFCLTDDWQREGKHLAIDFPDRRVIEVEGLLNFTDQLMQEATDGPSTLHPHPNEQFASDDDLLKEVEAFEGKEEEDDVIEEIDLYQGNEGDSPIESNPHWSFLDNGPSTSGTHFICSDWVSCISTKRLNYLTCQFYLPSTFLKPGPIILDRISFLLAWLPSLRQSFKEELYFLFTHSSQKCQNTSTSLISNSSQIPFAPW